MQEKKIQKESRSGPALNLESYSKNGDHCASTQKWFSIEVRIIWALGAWIYYGATHDVHIN
jgi:hypothetical protein